MTRPALSIDLEPPASTDWLADAACAGRDPEMFFPQPGETAWRALAVCADCPVTLECLATVLSMPAEQRYGVWAGHEFTQQRDNTKGNAHGKYRAQIRQR